MLIHQANSNIDTQQIYFVLSLTLRPLTSTAGTPNPKTSFPVPVSPCSSINVLTLLIDPPDPSLFSLLFEVEFVNPLNIPPIRFCQLVFLAPGNSVMAVAGLTLLFVELKLKIRRCEEIGVTGASLRTLPFNVAVFVPGVEINGDFFIFICFDPESWTAVLARRMRDSRISVFLVNAANSRFRR